MRSLSPLISRRRRRRRRVFHPNSVRDCSMERVIRRSGRRQKAWFNFLSSSLDSNGPKEEKRATTTKKKPCPWRPFSFSFPIPFAAGVSAWQSVLLMMSDDDGEPRSTPFIARLLYAKRNDFFSFWMTLKKEAHESDRRRRSRFINIWLIKQPRETKEWGTHADEWMDEKHRLFAASFFPPLPFLRPLMVNGMKNIHWPHPRPRKRCQSNWGLRLYQGHRSEKGAKWFGFAMVRRFVFTIPILGCLISCECKRMFSLCSKPFLSLYCRQSFWSEHFGVPLIPLQKRGAFFLLCFSCRCSKFNLCLVLLLSRSKLRNCRVADAAFGCENGERTKQGRCKFI